MLRYVIPIGSGSAADRLPPNALRAPTRKAASKRCAASSVATKWSRSSGSPSRYQRERVRIHSAPKSNPNTGDVVTNGSEIVGCPDRSPAARRRAPSSMSRHPVRTGAPSRSFGPGPRSASAMAASSSFVVIPSSPLFAARPVSLAQRITARGFRSPRPVALCDTPLAAAMGAARAAAVATCGAMPENASRYNSLRRLQRCRQSVEPRMACLDVGPLRDRIAGQAAAVTGRSWPSDFASGARHRKCFCIFRLTQYHRVCY